MRETPIGLRGHTNIGGGWDGMEWWSVLWIECQLLQHVLELLEPRLIG